ncbi:MAG: M24 family metallopeptidase [Vicinamibacterales bacterium]
MKKVFEIELAAQTAAVKAAKPGVPCEAVDAAARKVIEDAGYGPGYKFFTHRVGHGMGMDGHEWPHFVKGNASRWRRAWSSATSPASTSAASSACGWKTTCTSRPTAPR